jgi:hypothetical protein
MAFVISGSGVGGALADANRAIVRPAQSVAPIASRRDQLNGFCALMLALIRRKARGLQWRFEYCAQEAL